MFDYIPGLSRLRASVRFQFWYAIIDFPRNSFNPHSYLAISTERRIQVGSNRKDLGGRNGTQLCLSMIFPQFNCGTKHMQATMWGNFGDSLNPNGMYSAAHLLLTDVADCIKKLQCMANRAGAGPYNVSTTWPSFTERNDEDIKVTKKTIWCLDAVS